MRVLLFSLEFPPIVGGGGSHVYYLARALSKLDLDIIVLTAGEENCREHIDKINVIRRRCYLDLYYGKISYFKPIDDFLFVYKKFRPDIVHAFHSDPTLISLVVKNILKFPLVFTPHKTPEKGGRQKIYSKWLLHDFILTQKIDKIIVLSKFFKAEIDKFIKNKSKIKLIYPGVDTDLFYRRSTEDIKQIKNKLNIKENEYLLLCLARIRKRKGLPFLIQACGKLQKKIPIRLIITGPIESEQDKQIIKKITKKSNVNIIFKTFPPQHIPELISTADLLLLPSSHEGLGMVLLEAMACGTPVVGTRVEGITEVIKNKYNGLLVEYGDVKNLVRIIQNCLENQILREKLIQGGYETIAKKFNAQQCANSHFKIYKSLIKK